MNYNKDDYIYVIMYEYFNKKNDTIYQYTFNACWCRVLSYDIETNTYDVITQYGKIQRNVPFSCIHEKRTIQQGSNIRIKRLEPYYIWDKR